MIIQKPNSFKKLILASAATSILASSVFTMSANAIVPNDSLTPTDIIDTDGGVNGVGMFYRADGSVCTGTLINPRTVIFAAHCVNDVPVNAWGSGGLGAAFSFDVDAFPGFLSWFQSGFASNPSQYVYNISEIQFNPGSLATGFLEGDIALATLDTPATNVPTWALMMSALPAPDAISETTGTGYHVNITGYGVTGNGTNGVTQGIDWRRRAAENYLGALGSLDDRNAFLFGSTSGLPQNLYQLDFDDPLRGTANANVFDFNLYKDDALANEGTTGGGDSGGPLILDAANNDITDEDLVIGVLSGGSRFFGPQVFSSYGTSSFYQPLFLFADYIAATNPYRYVSAKAGDGNWEDGTHWQTDLDPAYRVLDADGNIVNGFPTEASGGIAGTDDKFGEVCFFDDCANFAGSESGIGNVSGGLTGISNNVGKVDGGVLGDLDFVAEDIAFGGNTVSIAEDTAFGTGVALPDPTLDNGLVGATDFTPDNIDADSFNGVKSRYFDVTLSAAGTTTLSSDVTIDRLTLNGGETALNIASAGTLNSLIDVQHLSGQAIIDGALNSTGDYLLMSGLLSGNGTIQTPFLTSIMGTIAPGAAGSIGTLSIDGSAILASGSQLLIDIGTNGQSDVLAISGDSSLGGTVTFAPGAGVRFGNQYTFLTTAGTQTGAFDNAQISAILQPILTYGPNSVTMEIDAASFDTVIDQSSAVQSSFAGLLDRNRGNSALQGLYDTVDLATGVQIRNILEDWAPTTETTARSVLRSSLSASNQFYRNRMVGFGSDNRGGTIATFGSPVQMASTDNAYMPTALYASNGGQMQTSSQGIDDRYAIYLSGSFIDGKSTAMPTSRNAGDDEFDGYSVAAGMERLLSNKSLVGASLSYTGIDGTTDTGAISESELLAVTLYGQTKTAGNIVVEGQVSVGDYSVDTARGVAFGATNGVLSSEDSATVFSTEVRVAKEFSSNSVVFAPGIGLNYTSANLDAVEETGGLAALHIERNDYSSLQGRVGFGLRTNAAQNITAHVRADFVHDFTDQAETLNVNFVNGVDANAPFLLSSSDQNWGEIGAGLSFDAGQAQINISADTTVGRHDIEQQTYQVGLAFKF